MCAVQKATCSVSAKKLSGFRFSTSRPDDLDRHQFLGNDLGRIQDVEAELLGLLFREDLQAQFPLRVLAGLDRFPQVATMVVGVGAGDLDGLFPHQRMGAELRLPMELDQHGLSRLVDQPEGVHAEALHHPVAARNGAVGHLPHQHVGGFGHQRDEVPEGVVRTRGLRHLVVRLGLHRMHQVRKLDRVLDEEDRHVVADQVPVAFVGIELDGEAAHIARGVLRATLAGHGREAHEHRRHLAGLLEGRGLGVLRVSGS